jgi:hypothetical protein
MVLPPRDFESRASTNSAIPACFLRGRIIREFNRPSNETIGRRNAWPIMLRDRVYRTSLDAFETWVPMSELSLQLGRWG